MHKMFIDRNRTSSEQQKTSGSWGHYKNGNWYWSMLASEFWGLNSEMHALFIFENLRNLHFGILKMRKEGPLAYMSPKGISIKRESMLSNRKTLGQVRKSVLSVCNTYLAATRKDVDGLSLKETFSRGNRYRI